MKKETIVCHSVSLARKHQSKQCDQVTFFSFPVFILWVSFFLILCRNLTHITPLVVNVLVSFKHVAKPFSSLKCMWQSHDAGSFLFVFCKMYKNMGHYLVSSSFMTINLFHWLLHEAKDVWWLWLLCLHSSFGSKRKWYFTISVKLKCKVFDLPLMCLLHNNKQHVLSFHQTASSAAPGQARSQQQQTAPVTAIQIQAVQENDKSF